MGNQIKIIIGIAGKNGSGKDTAADYLVEKYNAHKLVFSDLLNEALSVFIEKIGREDNAWLSTNLRSRFGDGVLSAGMKKKIDASQSSLIVISGFRDMGELTMLRGYPGGILLYVSADIRTRWERITKRAVKADDQVSFDQFVNEKEKLPSEQYIEKLGEAADFKVVNDGTREELEEQIDAVMDSLKERFENVK